MSYIENPKTKDSGIYAAIPQTGICPNKCKDCFFQSGRSFLEPLDENLPNMPESSIYNIIRINDGNDSNNNQEFVIEQTEKYPMRFYNTAIPKNLEIFREPVVLTLNPGKNTDKKIFKLKYIPKNLMMVRIRANMWNIQLIDEAVKYYTKYSIAVIITFMRYYNENIPEEYKKYYKFKKKITNSYWCLMDEGYDIIMNKYKNNKWVYSCSKEGLNGYFECHRCGNCLREYFYTKEKLKEK